MVSDRRLKCLTRRKTRQEDQRLAGSAMRDQSKDECWRVSHVTREEQSSRGSAGRRSLNTGLITDEEQLRVQVRMMS